MTESFYVNSSGPARLSIFGRIYKLEGGESCGPFPISALEQVNMSRDRHLLHIVKVDAVAEVLPEGGTKDEYFEPINTTLDAPAKEDPFVANASEKVELFPTEVAPAEDPTESTVGQVVPEPIKSEPLTTASIEPVAGAFTAEEVDETDDEDASKHRARRSRKTKSAE